jgi:hemolysin activation/secretion protein
VKGTIAVDCRTYFRPGKPAIRTAVRACLLIASVTVSGTGWAQQASHPPPQDPNQTEKRFDAFEAERQRAKNRAIPIPKVARPEARASAKPLFKLTAVSVEGANAISGDVIAEAYRSYIGKTVSQADLLTIVGTISDKYRDAGYHLSRAIVPPQDIKDGRIRIRMIEGQIAEVVLKGEGAEEFGVRPLLDIVVAERASRLETLERQLLLISDRAGVRIVDTALEEIGTATGRFRLIVYLKTWHIYTALGLDNWGTPAVGRLQAYSASAFNSYLISGDSLGLNLSTVPDTPRELKFGRLFYDVPVGLNGARLGATALYGDVWPGDFRKSLDDRTTTKTFEVRGSIDPLQSRKSSLRLTATAGFSDVSERDSFGTVYNDHIRTLGLAADYKLHDDLGGWNYLNLYFRQGLDVFGASHHGDDLLSNHDGSGNFSVLDFSFVRYQNLSDVMSVKISAAGQLASAALLTSQQFYLGGPIFGRGYYSGDLSGDNGIGGAAELRFDQKLKEGILKGYQLYGFVDGGAVWNHNDGRDDVLSLSSAGAGVRFYFADEFQADLTVAAPLKYHSPVSINHGARFLFSLSKYFEICPHRFQTRCS